VLSIFSLKIENDLMSYSQSDLESRMSLMSTLLPDVGKMLTEMREDPHLAISSKANFRDLVTAADHASEKRLIAAITEAFPHDSVLAEESGSYATGDSGFTWVIDPVDGTVNYAHGIPLYAISVGIAFDGKPAGGLVYLPVFKDLYQAALGRGAFKNGVLLKVSSIADIKLSIVVTGFPYDRTGKMDSLLAGVKAVLDHGTGIRRTGSAALDLCWVAEGRFDAYYELGLSPWDTCAAVVIAREAGAVVNDIYGQMYDPFKSRSIAASNPQIYPDLHNILSDFRNHLPE
jgi:myo-inositol-1(or 4)-monophosphatase